jgi:hypothetical protein
MPAPLRKLFLVPVTLALAPLPSAEGDALDIHDDDYCGFARGAYYGLMLAGEDYHVAWCMQAGLEYAAKGMGTGVEFQRTMESLLDHCRRGNSDDTVNHSKPVSDH